MLEPIRNSPLCKLIGIKLNCYVGFYYFFFLFSAWVVIQRYGHQQCHTKKKKKKEWKKKKESWLNSVQFQHVTKWQKHILFPKKLKYRHPRNKKHTCLNFLIESQSWHTDIHVIVKLCKKPIFFLKTTLKVLPLARKLVIKTHWHILYIVLSPLTLYWVLRGDGKQKKKLLHQQRKQSEGLCAPFPHRDEPSCARRVRRVRTWT